VSKRFSRTTRILGSAALLGLVAWRLDWTQLAGAFSGLDLRFWCLAVAVFVLAQLLSSVRWQMLAVPLGFTAPWRAYLSFYFIGMFFNLLLPTSVGGDVVRALSLAAQQKDRHRQDGRYPAVRVALAEAALSVFADRASGLAVLVALACIAGLLAPVLPGWMALVLLALGVGMVLGLVALPVLPLLGRLPFVGRRLGQLVDAGRVYLHRPKLLVSATLLSVLVQLASVVIVWLISEGLGLGVPVAYMAIVVPLVTLLTLLPISVSGVGLRELGMVVLLAPVGVGRAESVTLSLLSFAANAAVSLLGLGLYLFGRSPRWREMNMPPAEQPRRDPPGAKAAQRPVGRAQGCGAKEKEQGDAKPVGGGADQGRERQSPTAA
jgi:uncharacterized membrane protein YbhN (UPF0104 family)